MSENPLPLSLPRFYLGAVTPHGYIQHTQQLKNACDGWRTYILKGAPGSGKARFLENLAAELSLHYKNIELIACPSQQNSLDGVILHDIGVNILNGSYPHLAEPETPGVWDYLIPLGDWAEEPSSPIQRREMTRLWEQLRENARQCRRFLEASASLLEDARQIALSHTNLSKIQRFASRFSVREIPPSQFGKGEETLRFLSAFTSEGILTLEQTPLLLCGHITYIRDEYGAASGEVLAALRQEFLAKGFDLITCRCPLFPFTKIDHLFVPELGLGFMTQNKLHHLKALPDKTIHAQRFTNIEELRKSRARLSWDGKAAREMLSHTCQLLEHSGEIYRRLQSYGQQAASQKQADQQLYQLIRLLLESCPPL